MSVASVGYHVSPLPIPDDFRRQPVNQNDMVNHQTEKKTKPQVIHSTTEDLQRISHAFNRKLQFTVDQHSNQVIVKVIDKETDKVIRELPPEELQRLHRYLKEAVGLLFNEMV